MNRRCETVEDVKALIKAHADRLNYLVGLLMDEGRPWEQINAQRSILMDMLRWIDGEE